MCRKRLTDHFTYEINKYYLSIKIFLKNKEFGVSPIPIREVLILLESEKLVRIIPNNVVYVTDVSFQELKERIIMT